MVPAVYVYLLRLRGTGTAQPHEVLLQLRQGTGFMDGHWAAGAAGHVERGESVYAAAQREAAEELALGDLALEPLCAMQRTGATGLPVDERVDYFFTATSWAGTPRVMEPVKCAELRWCALDQLPSPVVPHERQVLEHVRAGDTPPVLSFGF